MKHRPYTRHFETWLKLVEQVTREVDGRTHGMDIDEYTRQVDQALLDCDAPIDVPDYERLYGSRWETSRPREDTDNG